MNISIRNLIFNSCKVGILTIFLLPLGAEADPAGGYPQGRLKTLSSTFDNTWETREQEAKKACSQVLSVELPPKDQPSAQERQELKGCDSESLYYGFDKAADFVKARKCAYLDIENSGIPVLMMVYANGKGVARNLDLALRLACMDSVMAPAEYLGRIEHLNELRQKKVGDGPFDYCDDITSSAMQNICAAKQSSLASAEREKQLDQLIAKWTASDQQNLKILVAAWHNYLKLRWDEIDQSGSASVAYATEDEEILEEEFLNALKRFENGDFPRFTEKDFSDADRELNKIYKEALQNAGAEGSGTVSKENIRVAQRAWLKYRDAWIVFAKRKYPSITEFSWKTWLTRDRTMLLKEGYASSVYGRH